MKIKNKKKIALVLSGGGIKAAAFHIGVCLALKEKGFKFAGGTKDEVNKNFPDEDPYTIRTYVGSSAGAFVCAILSAGYSLEALVNAFEVGAGQNKVFSNKKSDELNPIKYRDIFSINGVNILKSIPNTLMRKTLVKGGLESFLKDKFKVNGLFTTKGLEKYLRSHALTHNDFKQLGVDLFIVGTQLNHSRKVIFGPYPETSKTDKQMLVSHASISQAVAASISLPPVFAPYGIKNEDDKEIFYFDGEIRETLSAHIAADHGADLVISSYSVQPYHFNEEMGSLHNYGIPAILNQALYQVIQQKIEKHISYQNDIRSIYQAIDGYFKSEGLPEKHKQKVLEIIQRRVNYKPEVDYIYVAPPAKNHEMFFVDHFSLNPQILEKIVKIGFKSTINSLRKHDF